MPQSDPPDLNTKSTPRAREDAPRAAPIRSALFIVDSNPLASHRPAEAIRIAAGLHAWQKIQVHLYLHDHTARPLLEHQDEIRDPDNFRHYLPILAQGREDSVLLVSDRLGASALEGWGEDCWARPVSDDELAERAASCECVLRF